MSVKGCDRAGDVGIRKARRREALMETIWYSRDMETAIFLLVVTGDAVHCLKIAPRKKRNRQQAADACVEALDRGEDPANLEATWRQTIPLDSLRRVVLLPNKKGMKFEANEDVSPASIALGVEKGDLTDIGQRVADRAGLAHEPHREEIGVASALLVPGVIGALSLLLWAGTYIFAVEIAAGRPIDFNRIRVRELGFAKLLAAIARALGTTGCLIVGAILLVTVLGWCAKNVIRRPEKLVWARQRP
jgi:hypothetical protein